VASTADGTAGAPPDRQGVASGLVTTSAQVGTALGLAAVIPFAAARTAALGGGPVAQVAGYEWGIAVVAAAAAAGAAAVAGTAVLGTARRASLHDHQPDVRGLPR
jgi:hypothetical protein